MRAETLRGLCVTAYRSLRGPWRVSEVRHAMEQSAPILRVDAGDAELRARHPQRNPYLEAAQGRVTQEEVRQQLRDRRVQTCVLSEERSKRQRNLFGFYRLLKTVVQQGPVNESEEVHTKLRVNRCPTIIVSGERRNSCGDSGPKSSLHVEALCEARTQLATVAVAATAGVFGLSTPTAGSVLPLRCLPISRGELLSLSLGLRRTRKTCPSSSSMPSRP